jgi:hypothetical protein
MTHPPTAPKTEYKQIALAEELRFAKPPGVRGSLSCAVLLGVAPQRTTDKNSGPCHEAQTSKDAHTQARTLPKTRARPSAQGYLRKKVSGKVPWASGRTGGRSQPKNR